MKRILQSCFLLFMFAMTTIVNAQDKTVTGTVTSMDDGAPLPGVSVEVKGTKIATQTSPDGKYSIVVPSSATQLVFSYIGFISKTVTVSGRSVSVALETDNKQLSEVVVVAYGTQKKGEISGSVATLKSDDIEKRVVTNITNALAGLAPGVNVGSGNGQPGTGATVRLRGFGSFAASSSPLYVVDGSAFDGNIGDINPNDIESVSILKDATSAALYGSRAANGVIMITTKKGKIGESKLNLNLNQGYSERGTPEYDRVNAYEYYPLAWRAMRNNLVYGSSALTPEAAAIKATNEIQTQLLYNPFNVPNNQIVGTDGLLNPNATLLYNDFDWYAPIQRTGKRTDATMSVSGASAKSNYYVSMGYLDDNGYIQKSNFKRFNGRINVSTEVKPWLKTGLNVSGSRSNGSQARDNSTDNGNSIINVFNFARGIGPIYPVYARDANGNTILNNETSAPWYDYGAHPGAVNRPQGAYPGRHVIYETLINDNLNNRSLLGGRTFATIKFLKDFEFTPSFNVDIRNNTNTQFNSPLIGDGATLKGYGFKSNSTITSYTFNQVLNYKKSIKDHNFSALVGHENYDYSYSYSSGSKTGLILQGNTVFENFVTPYTVGGYDDKETLESYFSKATYNFKEKYFLEGSIRTDGSSRFSKDSRWGTFFSAGATWAITKESFMEQLSWISDLRLKASYGQVGNNQLSTLYAYQAFYDLGWNNGSEPGLILSTAATPELQWESSNTFNAGLAFSLFKNRLFGELEFYKRGSDRLIFSVPQPLSDPVTSINKNIGSMYNTGWELQLGGDVIKAKNFNWNMITNWSIFKNEITKMPAENPAIISGTKRREVGRDYYSFYLRQFAGVDPADGSSLYIPAEGTAAANIRTVNGVEYVTNQSYAKFDYSGTAIPDLIGSINNSFTYKRFDLSFLINYQIGGKYYDGTYQGLMSTGSYGAALHVDALKSWTTPGQISDIPRLDYGATANLNATSSRWLIDASYISFRNVNLGYSIPKTLLRKIDVSNAKIFVAGENLGLISKRKGLNPTESFDGTNGNTYLPSRILSFGLNLTL